MPERADLCKYLLHTSPTPSRCDPLLPPVLRQVVVADRPPGGAVEIVELAVLERPEESRKAEAAERERHRHEIDEHVHRPTPFAWRARNALSVTRIDEPDIASAAISGVTNPKIASGTAIRL